MARPGRLTGSSECPSARSKMARAGRLTGSSECPSARSKMVRAGRLTGSSECPSARSKMARAGRLTGSLECPSAHTKYGRKPLLPPVAHRPIVIFRLESRRLPLGWARRRKPLLLPLVNMAASAPSSARAWLSRGGVGGSAGTAMAVPRLELNLVRLLCRCEALAAEKRDPSEWRLEKYVSALEEMLQALKEQSSKPAPEMLNEYSRKVDFLKGMLEAEKLSSSSEKALANQFLAPGRTPTTTKERVPATKTVHLQTRARYTGEMRNELLGTESSATRGSGDLNLRKRTGLGSDEKQSAAELDAVLQHHHSVQEKLAEEMLSLARSLKNNTLAAQNVIKQDNQTLSHSIKMADQNFEKLKTESERLEQHAKKSVNWLLWIVLIFVCFIFISMILFIRIFPKLK